MITLGRSRISRTTPPRPPPSSAGRGAWGVSMRCERDSLFNPRAFLPLLLFGSRPPTCLSCRRLLPLLPWAIARRWPRGTQPWRTWAPSANSGLRRCSLAPQAGSFSQSLPPLVPCTLATFAVSDEADIATSIEALRSVHVHDLTPRTGYQPYISSPWQAASRDIVHQPHHGPKVKSSCTMHTWAK